MWLIREIKFRCRGIRFGGGGYNRGSSNGVVRGGDVCVYTTPWSKESESKVYACVCVCLC